MVAANCAPLGMIAAGREPMTSLINFRDFGGDATGGGAQVVTGRLFRGGHIAGLGEAETSDLLAHDFGLVVDLRYSAERDSERSPWPAHAIDRVIAHDGSREDAPHLQIIRAVLQEGRDIDPAYHAYYSALPFDGLYRPLFATAIKRVAATPGRVLVHCTAGKDRTGTLVALLLSLLGVPEDAIVADYMRSLGAPGMDKLRADVIRRVVERDDAPLAEQRIDELIGVKPAYILTALKAVAARSGSVEAYFHDSGVTDETVQTLRRNWLA